MRIGLNAHLLSRQAGYRSAGVHGYIYNLLAHLPHAAPDDWDFVALVGRDNPAQFPGITMCQAGWDTQRPTKRIVWEQFIQPRYLGDFDLYHALAFVAPVVSNLPSLVTVYDLSFLHYPQVHSPARRLYLRLFTALSCRRARRVIAISHSTAQDVHQSFGIPPDKIDVAACGYNTDWFKPLPPESIANFRKQQGLPERFWLFVGTLEPRKNLPTLLEAYASLSESERLPLVLAGAKGWQYDAIFETIERHNLGQNVWFPGFINAENLPLWYNSAETFIYPSVFEGFGLPVLEAMACGTPVIVSDTSSLPEVVGEAGMRVSPHDTADWTQALLTAFRDSQWRQDASVRGLWEAKRYRWEDTAHETIRSYQQVLEQERL